jgi:hypothetical protein
LRAHDCTLAFFVEFTYGKIVSGDVAMNRMIVKSQVGKDGVLHVDIPIGEADAGRDVQITIEPDGAATTSREAYLRFLDETAGAWQGEFERPEQGEFEIRDPF